MPPKPFRFDRLTPLEDRLTPASFAVGADLGAVPDVRVYDQAGAVLYTIHAYDPSFKGGVRVAVADVTGDGTADVITAPGPGIAAEVKVFDGLDGTLVRSTPAFESAFLGGAFVATGDIFGTGTPDVVVSPDEGGGPRVQIRDGKTGAVRADFFGIADASFRGGARTAVADVNGDGKAEVVVAAGVGGGPRVTVWGGSSIRAGAPAPISDTFVFEQTLRNGVYVAAGDLNGDGYADLVAGGGPGGGPRVLGLSGKDVAVGSARPAVLVNFFAGDPARRDGVRVAVSNSGAGGAVTILASPGPGGGGRVTAFSGRDGSPLTGVALPAGGGFVAAARAATVAAQPGTPATPTRATGTLTPVTTPVTTTAPSGLAAFTEQMRQFSERALSALAGGSFPDDLQLPNLPDYSAVSTEITYAEYQELYQSYTFSQQQFESITQTIRQTPVTTAPPTTGPATTTTGLTDVPFHTDPSALTDALNRLGNVTPLIATPAPPVAVSPVTSGRLTGASVGSSSRLGSTPPGTSSSNNSSRGKATAI